MAEIEFYTYRKNSSLHVDAVCNIVISYNYDPENPISLSLYTVQVVAKQKKNSNNKNYIIQVRIYCVPHAL